MIKTFSKRKREGKSLSRASSLDSPTSSPSVIASPSSQSNDDTSSQPSASQISSSQSSQPSSPQSSQSSQSSSQSSSQPSSSTIDDNVTPTKKLKQWDWWKSKPNGSPTSRASKSATPKKKDTTTKKLEQTFLDLGQKHFDAKCSECGMMYAPGVQEDALMHARFHKKHESIINFPQWKTCRVVKEYPFVAGAVICVGKDDTPTIQKKVYKVRKMMDKELGYVDASNPSITADQKNKVVGCLVAEQIERAYPVIIIDHGAKKQTPAKEETPKKDNNKSLKSTPTSTLSPQAKKPKVKEEEDDELDLDKICETDNTIIKPKKVEISKKEEEDDELDRICELDSTVPKPDKSKQVKDTPIKAPKSKEAGTKNFSVSCSKEPQEAVCGISRIWTARTHRRQGIASKMLDCVRSNLVYGYTVPKELCAFTQPTADGKLFFENYRGTKEFLVYL